MLNNKKQGQIPIFKEAESGIIFSPQHSLVLCGFGADGGSRGVRCGKIRTKPPSEDDGCVAGCTNSAVWCDPQMLRPDEPPWCDGHPWRPRDFAELLRHFSLRAFTYNEVRLKLIVAALCRAMDAVALCSQFIVDAVTWGVQLPWSIEAFFYPENALTACTGPSCHSELRALHQQFLTEYGVSEAQIPLLKLRLEDWDEPFAEG
eukprot:941016-Prymnesium_polylepis.2